MFFPHPRSEEPNHINALLEIVDSPPPHQKGTDDLPTNILNLNPRLLNHSPMLLMEKKGQTIGQIPPLLTEQIGQSGPLRGSSEILISSGPFPMDIQRNTEPGSAPVQGPIPTPMLPTEEEDLPHKSFDLCSACADFISKDWKLVDGDSLEVIKDYKFATFKRILDPQSDDIFLRIFNKQILDLMTVRLS